MLRKPSKRPTPSNWASLKPFGIGEQRPNNFGEVFRAGWENRDSAGYAWRILNEGVCDGCALGTTGMKDWTIDGIHLCNIRLRLLRLNTMGALDPARARRRRRAALRFAGRELRALGRLPEPMLRRHGETGFTPVSWDEALDLAAERIGAAGPDRCGFFLTSRGMSNESYYAAQKAVRAIGTNSIDNAARVCHSPSTFALKEALGVGATTCSYSRLDRHRPRRLHRLQRRQQPAGDDEVPPRRQEGGDEGRSSSTRSASPGWSATGSPRSPRAPSSGRRSPTSFFTVNTGGDIGFLVGALKHLIEIGWHRRRIRRGPHRRFRCGRGALPRRRAGRTSRPSPARPASEIGEFAALLAGARNGVIVWSMGVTQHERGEDNVRAIVNLALARGWVGREGCGLMPIRGHSGVQGGAEMGCYATAFPGGAEINEANAAALSERWGFEVPASPGLTAPEMIDAAGRGELDVLFASGGNFLDVLPDPDSVATTLGRLPLRVHMDIVASSQMLVDPPPGERGPAPPGGDPLRGPGRGDRDERPSAGSSSAPRSRPARIAEARPEWSVFSDLAARVRPELAERIRFAGTAAIRGRDRRGGAALRADRGASARAATRSSTAARSCRRAPSSRPPTGEPTSFPLPSPSRCRPTAASPLSTRRGKQFNSMVQERARHAHRRRPRRGPDRRRRCRAARRRRRRRGAVAKRARRAPLHGAVGTDRAGQPPGPLAGGKRADRRPALAAGRRPRLQRAGRARAALTPERGLDPCKVPGIIDVAEHHRRVAEATQLARRDHSGPSSVTIRVSGRTGRKAGTQGLDQGRAVAGEQRLRARVGGQTRSRVAPGQLGDQRRRHERHVAGEHDDRLRRACPSAATIPVSGWIGSAGSSSTSAIERRQLRSGLGEDERLQPRFPGSGDRIADQRSPGEGRAAPSAAPSGGSDRPP